MVSDDDDNFPNADDSGTNDLLVRRFFLFDPVSGTTSLGQEFVHFATSIHIQVRLLRAPGAATCCSHTGRRPSPHCRCLPVTTRSSSSLPSSPLTTRPGVS